MSRILLHNAQIANEGEVYIGSVLICGNRIEAILKQESTLDSLPPLFSVSDKVMNSPIKATLRVKAKQPLLVG